jgi:hypothetical protein
MSVLPVEAGGTMFLNALMLFLVSIEPYLLSLLIGASQASGAAVLNFASEVFAMDVAGLNLIIGLFDHQLTIEERKFVSPELVGRYRRNRNLSLFAAVLFVVSMLPLFWSWEIIGTPARFYLWIAILPFIWTSRLISRHKKGRS